MEEVPEGCTPLVEPEEMAAAPLGHLKRRRQRQRLPFRRQPLGAVIASRRSSHRAGRPAGFEMHLQPDSGGAQQSFVREPGPAQADIHSFLAERHELRGRIPVWGVGAHLGE